MAVQARSTTRLRSAARWFSALSLLVALAASAATLDDAKSAGQIGECVDGYVHLVDPNAPDAVKALVKDVNDKRRKEYAGIAKTRGTSLENVAALAGAKLVQRAPAGQYVKDSSGAWHKK
jgi:uncharacterized protein YdbL (DUF1318 family)